MPTKKQPSVVSPQEWVERTSLRLSSRSGTTRTMDTAYTRWYNSLSQPNPRITEKYRGELQTVIEAYHSEHGADWNKLERNKTSNGLIKYIYELIRVVDPAVGATRRRLAQDAAHSRYGVLYLLGNIDIDMNFGSILLEGVGAVGGALASGFGTDYKQIHNVDKVDKTAFSVFGQDVSISDAYGYSATVGTGLADQGLKKLSAPAKGKTAPIHGTRDIATHGATVPMAPPLHSWGGKGAPCAIGNINYLQAGTRSLTTRAPRDDHGFPLTVRAFEAMEKRPVLATAFAPLSGAVLVGAAFTDLMRKLIEAATWLVQKLLGWLKEKLAQMKESPITVGLDTIKGLVSIVVKQIAASAVPFVGAGIDLAVGLAQSFNAIKMKVGAWLERRKIRLMDGHPALLAARIEKVMTNNILSGLWSTIKGAIQMALAATIPGIQSLVSAMATGVEWVIKFFMRLSELASLKLFLLTAKTKFLQERERTTIEDGSPHRTVHERGGLIHDLERFKDFYQEGCNASPIIAMLTLNTGICGSQWQLQSMFSDIGMLGQKEFDSGTAYFSRLKKFGYDYLADCGFRFRADLAVPSAPVNERRYIEGLLLHAQGIHKQSDRMGIDNSGIAWAPA